jgi:hypothetical protein
VDATPADDFVTDMKSDYHLIADTVNAPFAKSLGFFSTLGWSTPPGVFDFMAGPHIEVGLGAGADLINLPSLDKLTTLASAANQNIDLPGFVPVPFPVGTARVGLMNGLDLGLKVLYLPDISLAGFAANYTGWGLDLRYKILDGSAALPTVTAGISWDNMDGNISIITGINQTGSYVDSHNSTTYNDLSLSSTSTYALAWNVKSFGAHVDVGKDLGILYPFVSVGFQRNSGSVSSTLSSSGVPPSRRSSSRTSRPGSTWAWGSIGGCWPNPTARTSRAAPASGRSSDGAIRRRMGKMIPAAR